MKSNLKDSALSSFPLFENKVDTSNPIHKIRLEALGRFEKIGFPQKRQLLWEYTSLNGLISKDYNIFPQKTDLNPKDLVPYVIESLEAYKIVFINGFYVPDLSDLVQSDEINICPLSQALKEKEYQSTIAEYFDKATPSTNSLAHLNTAFTQEGIYVHVKQGYVVDKPIQLLFLSTSEENVFVQPRNLIIVEKNAEVNIIEKHHNLSTGFVFTNSVTEGFVKEDALLGHYKIQNDVEHTALIDNTFFKQEACSEVSIHTVSFGSTLLRNNLNVSQHGSNANTKLHGLTMIGNKQHVDHNTLIHHHSPNCESFEEYKTLVDDAATAIFNGQVIVDKDAQKLNAYQQNRNILIGEKASAKAKPQLEIFADDVKCSHGCTIGQIDQEMLFYLQSRGIPKKQAEGILMYAFANNILEDIAIPEIKDVTQNLIADKFSINLTFDV